ncbi:peptide-methionine (S)-S-oxide reductase MsrA [Cerasibacillus terrae]|uniref:Peptide methionine sulfoxide reductase MsrA n=1 Tax=Cerasibacillus terrae TaxID=2498845 RepID=A0A5C8NWP7_9BACI|nr:peptide-methionine (S)-S-oxide reductase MsrA [Cerasibacillus terrae]TXL65657.1 peptide-methionine (S)-S-oxide reductase MsrA [Cerasibacillus terrae]
MTNIKKATFAGGCFWCMVKPFDQWDGVKRVLSGYTGGHVENPTYDDVKKGTTGHYEAVEITYDESVISYETIVHIFWQQIDPTDNYGQFHDRGDSYRTAIFYHDDSQKQVAIESKQDLVRSGKFTKPIVTKILAASPFYPAEEEHQNFYLKSKATYEEDRKKSGRDAFLQKMWAND